MLIGNRQKPSGHLPEKFDVKDRSNINGTAPRVGGGKARWRHSRGAPRPCSVTAHPEFRSARAGPSSCYPPPIGTTGSHCEEADSRLGLRNGVALTHGGGPSVIQMRGQQVLPERRGNAVGVLRSERRESGIAVLTGRKGSTLGRLKFACRRVKLNAALKCVLAHP